MVYQYLVCSRGVGSIQRNLYWPHLKRVMFPCPAISEQRAIVRNLEDTTANVDVALAHASQLIEFLREYRTRLIADVVTGKLDVREAVARLPDEIEEPQPHGEDEERSEPVDNGIERSEALH